MVLNQAKLRRNYYENSRKCIKQSICFRCLGKIGDLRCRLCETKIHQPGSGIEPRSLAPIHSECNPCTGVPVLVLPKIIGQNHYFTVFTASITVFLLFSYIIPAIQIDTRHKLPILLNRYNPIFSLLFWGKLAIFGNVLRTWCSRLVRKGIQRFVFT